MFIKNTFILLILIVATFSGIKKEVIAATNVCLEKCMFNQPKYWKKAREKCKVSCHVTKQLDKIDKDEEIKHQKALEREERRAKEKERKKAEREAAKNAPVNPTAPPPADGTAQPPVDGTTPPVNPPVSPAIAVPVNKDPLP